jgi:hypothetical protein
MLGELTAVASNAMMTTEDLVKREAAIAKKAAELARREIEVRIALARTIPNFPPKFLCFDPIVYHSIPNEVPVDRQRFVRGCYMNYYLTVALIILNILTAAVAYGSPTAGGVNPQPWPQHFGVSFLYLLGIPGAFVVWYYQLYLACSRCDGNYMMALIGVAIALLFAVFMMIGVVGYGGCGWLFVIAAQADAEKAVVQYMGIAMGLLWLFQGLGFLFVLYRLWGYRKWDKLHENEKGSPAVVAAQV